MDDLNERYSICLELLIQQTRDAIKKDLAGKSPTRIARYTGAMDALRLCDNKGPKELERLPNQKPPESLLSLKPAYSAIALGEFDRTLAWICHCVSAFLVMNGQSGIVTDIHDQAALEMLAICEKAQV